MDERQVRAILAVMNFTAPFEGEWCAQKEKNINELAREYGIEEQWRFYLVTDETSKLHTADGVVWA